VLKLIGIVARLCFRLPRMLTVLLTLALAAEPDAGEKEASREGETHWQKNATARFLGAFAGGAVGVAIPLSLSALLPRCGVFACQTTLSDFLGATAPLLSALGASLGLFIAGGDPSIGTSLVLATIGALVVQYILLATIATAPNPRGEHGPAIIGATTAGLAIEAYGLLLRNDAEDDRSRVLVPPARVVLEGVAFLSPLLLMGLVAVLPLATSPGGQVAALTIAGASLAVAPFLAYAAHRAQKGRGSVLSAYLGLGVALVVGTLFFLAPALTPSTVPMFGSPVGDLRRIGMGGLPIGGTVIGAVVSIPFFLEWSHTRAVLAERPAQGAEDVRDR